MSAFALPARLPAAARVLPDKLARSRSQTASFGDLVHAHWQWKHEHADDDALRERYEATRARFEAEHGKIVDDYWSARGACRGGGLLPAHALGARAVGAASQHGAAGGRPPGLRTPAARCRAAVQLRAANVLSGMTQRIATSNLFSLTRDVMASLENEKGKPTGLAEYKSDLGDVEDSQGQAGARQAQIVYLKGLMRGLVALVVLAPLLALALSAFGVRRVDTAVLVGCLVAGSFGATMSVLMRMSAGGISTSTTRSGVST